MCVGRVWRVAGCSGSWRDAEDIEGRGLDSVVVAHSLPPFQCPSPPPDPVVADTLSAWPRSRDIESIPYFTTDVVACELPGSSSEEVPLFA